MSGAVVKTNDGNLGLTIAYEVVHKWFAYLLYRGSWMGHKSLLGYLGGPMGSQGIPWDPLGPWSLVPGPDPWSLVPRSQGPRVPGSLVPGSLVPRSQGPWSQGPRVPGP